MHSDTTFPKMYLTVVDRGRLVIETNATEITSNASVRPLRPEHIDRLLTGVRRNDDGRYRATALKVPTDVVSLVGPYQLFGTRNDDPNDTVPHEHRRDLRGLQVFAAWLNHTRMDALHTFDIVVKPRESLPTSATTCSTSWPRWAAASTARSLCGRDTIPYTASRRR